MVDIKFEKGKRRERQRRAKKKKKKTQKGGYACKCNARHAGRPTSRPAIRQHTPAEAAAKRTVQARRRLWMGGARQGGCC